MDARERLSFFNNNFDLISAGAYHKGRKKIISDGEDRVCRFCGKDENETSFRNESHAIPECLGNHQLILSNECDKCNKYFSESLEDHLDKFTKPYRIAGQIFGKSGIPKYRSNNKKSRIEFNDVQEIRSQIGEDFVSVDEENKELKVNLHQESHSPIGVYKALIKIAISIIESKEEISAFSKTISWLMEKDLTKSVVKPALLMQSFIPGPRPTNGVAVFLFRRKQSVSDVPYAIFIIGFGNVVLQIMVPSHIDDGITTTYSLPYFPSPFEFMERPYGHIKYGTIDVSVSEKVKRDFPIIYSFDEMVEIDPSV